MDILNVWVVWLVFGHLFGDYMFQNDYMAYNKKKPGRVGGEACLLHCVVYTCIVIYFLYISGVIVTNTQSCLLFLSHWVLDRYTLLDKWCVFFGKNSWDTAIRTGGIIDLDKTVTVEEAVKISFGSLVYVIMDNGLHIFIMFLIMQYIH